MKGWQVCLVLIAAVIVVAGCLVAWLRAEHRRRVLGPGAGTIEREAFQIYVDRGSLPGQDKADWAEAVARLARLGDIRGGPPGGLGFALVTLAIMFPLLGFSFIAVTATQIQARFAGLGSVTRPLTVGHVADLAERLDAFKVAERESWPVVNKDFDKASKARVLAEKARAQADAAAAKAADTGGRLRRKLKELSVILPTPPADDFAAARDLLAAAPSFAACSGDEACGSFARTLGERIGSYDALDKVARGLEEDAAGVREAAEATYERIQGTSYTRRSLFERQFDGLEAPVRAKVEGALIEYERAVSNGWFISRYSYLVARSPVETLTVWLVLALGALGAILQIAYTFITGGKPLWSYLFFRPLFGAVTALTVYIFFKAGVLVLAVSTDQTGQAAVNPYTTGFIAIISGLLSEQAILTLRAAGLRVFSGEVVAHPARWTRPEVAAMVDDQLAASLARLLDLSVADLRKKLSGFVRSSWDEQRVLAASLGKEVRDLFSDLPPSDATDAGQTD